MDADSTVHNHGSSRSIRTRTFAALAHSGFRRYYMGQGVSLIGTWLQSAAVKWIVFDQTGSEFLLGVVEVASLMPGLLVGLFAGALADRAAPRAMIILMQFSQMGLALILALLVGLQVVQFWQMVLILALTRVSVAFEMPSRQVFFYELVGPEMLPNAIALNSGLFNATRVIGPSLAGVCLTLLGATGCFTLNGVSYIAAIAAVYSLRLPERPSHLHAGRYSVRDFLGGLDYLFHDRRILYHFLLMALFGLVGMGYEAMIPAYARRVVHTEVEGYSLLLASGGIGATAGAILVASLGGVRRRERLVILGMALFSFFLGSAALFPRWADGGWSSAARLSAASLCLLGSGFGASVFYSSTQTLIQLAVPASLRGRVMGVWMIAFSGSVPLGALWTGRAALAWGVTNVMSVSALVCAAVSLLVLATGLLEPRREEPGAVVSGSLLEQGPAGD